LIGQLKLFSQLFERRFLLPTSSERRIDRTYSDKTVTVSISNPCSFGMVGHVKAVRRDLWSYLRWGPCSF